MCRSRRVPCSAAPWHEDGGAPRATLLRGPPRTWTGPHPGTERTVRRSLPGARQRREGATSQSARAAGTPSPARSATVVASVLVVAVAAAVVIYIRLDGNITGVDMTAGLGEPARHRGHGRPGDRPAADEHPADGLGHPRGSRTRTSSPAYPETAATEHSDTNLLVHLSGRPQERLRRQHPARLDGPAPRLRRPAGDRGSGRRLRHVQRRLHRRRRAERGGRGRPDTVATVEANTDIPIDHFAVINFEGFRDMVDALGGVDICVPEAIEDDTTGLSAARRHLAPRRPRGHRSSSAPARASATAPTSAGSTASRRSCPPSSARPRARACCCARTGCSASSTPPRSRSPPTRRSPARAR